MLSTSIKALIFMAEGVSSRGRTIYIDEAVVVVGIRRRTDCRT